MSDSESNSSNDDTMELESESVDDEDDETDDDVYDVEAIVDSRFKRGSREFKVRWKGWSEKYDTWEPYENLVSCQEMIDQFDHKSSSDNDNGQVTTVNVELSEFDGSFTKPHSCPSPSQDEIILSEHGTVLSDCSSGTTKASSSRSRNGAGKQAGGRGKGRRKKTRWSCGNLNRKKKQSSSKARKKGAKAAHGLDSSNDDDSSNQSQASSARSMSNQVSRAAGRSKRAGERLASDNGKPSLLDSKTDLFIEDGFRLHSTEPLFEKRMTTRAATKHQTKRLYTFNSPSQALANDFASGLPKTEESSVTFSMPTVAIVKQEQEMSSPRSETVDPCVFQQLLMEIKAEAEDNATSTPHLKPLQPAVGNDQLLEVDNMKLVVSGKVEIKQERDQDAATSSIVPVPMCQQNSADTVPLPKPFGFLSECTLHQPRRYTPSLSSSGQSELEDRKQSVFESSIASDDSFAKSPERESDLLQSTVELSPAFSAATSLSETTAIETVCNDMSSASIVEKKQEILAPPIANSVAVVDSQLLQSATAGSTTASTVASAASDCKAVVVDIPEVDQTTTAAASKEPESADKVGADNSAVSLAKQKQMLIEKKRSALPLPVDTDLNIGDFMKLEMRQFQKEEGKIMKNDEFLSAVLNGNFLAVRAGLLADRRHKKLDIEQPNVSDLTLLMQLCCRQCDPAHECDDIVELLVQNGANINRQNRAGNTALLLACDRGLMCKVSKLLSLGASANLANSEGDTALILACKRGNTQVVSRLLEYGANFNATNLKQETPLACAEKHCAELLRCHIQRTNETFFKELQSVLGGLAKPKRYLFPMHCYSLCESNTFRIMFSHEPSHLPKYHTFMLFIGIAKFVGHSTQVRFHGVCPISNVTLNAVPQRPLQQDCKFLFTFHPLREGFNELIVHCTLTRPSQMKLLIQAFLVSLTKTDDKS